jgi:hypothetical protein
MPQTVTLSVDLVNALVQNLGNQKLAEVLPLFNRLIQETQGQLKPPTDLAVPHGAPAAKKEKPVAPPRPKRVK